MGHVAIQDWHDYLLAEATLTGLVFVAVSINLVQILTVPGLSSLAAKSLVQLLGAMFISMTAHSMAARQMHLGSRFSSSTSYCRSAKSRTRPA
jgi:hypothetical protein